MFSCPQILITYQLTNAPGLLKYHATRTTSIGQNNIMSLYPSPITAAHVLQSLESPTTTDYEM